MGIRYVLPLLVCAAAALSFAQANGRAFDASSSRNPADVTQSRSSPDTQGYVTSYSERSARTVPVGLDQLTQRAQTIVRGSAVSAVVEPHPQFKNLLTVVVSVRVDQTLKGAPQKTLTFRQYIWDQRDRLGAAGYRKGEELILLLGPVSQYGLTSPVGLEQGRFRVLQDAKGNITAVNGRGNLGLFQSVEQRSRAQGVQLSSKTTALVRRTQGGAVGLGDLEEAIRTFARTK